MASECLQACLLQLHVEHFQDLADCRVRSAGAIRMFALYCSACFVLMPLFCRFWLALFSGSLIFYASFSIIYSFSRPASQKHCLLTLLSSLHSMEQGLLFVPFAHTSTSQAHPLSVVGPSVWMGFHWYSECSPGFFLTHSTLA